MIEIFHKIVRHIGLFLTMLISYCNNTVKPALSIGPPPIVIAKPAPGDTARYVTIEMDIIKAKKPAFYFTDLPYDKNKGLLLMKDDGLLTDYTIVYKILSGGTVNGKRYPGFTYTDGTGKNIGYKYSFAVNPNEGHTTDLNNVTSWAQMNEMAGKGHTLMNHSLNHSGQDKLKAIKDAEINLYKHIYYRMTEIVPPSNDEGYIGTGLQLGYHMFSSEFGDPIPDGYNKYLTNGTNIPVTTQDFDKVLVYRNNLGDQWNAEELQRSKTYIDQAFNNVDSTKKLIGAAFSHGPFGDRADAADNFFAFIMYIKNHPRNHDSVWITSSKEMMDYERTKRTVKIASQHYDKLSGKYKIVLDMGAVNPNVIYRSLSLKVTGGTISNVKGTGVKEVTYNSSTGLINIYKTDRSKVKDPAKDVLPPQIISTVAKDNIITITYDRDVNQTKAEGYTVIGNNVLQLKGGGKIWQLIMQDNVKPDQVFDYRIQKGDAIDLKQPALHVCTYIGLPIKI